MTGKKRTLLGKINNLFPTCKEMTMLMVKEHEIRLTRTEKLKLLFHGSMCRFCRMFRKQSGFLHQHIHQAAKQAEADQPQFTMKPETKSNMQTEINKHLG